MKISSNVAKDIARRVKDQAEARKLHARSPDVPAVTYGYGHPIATMKDGDLYGQAMFIRGDLLRFDISNRTDEKDRAVLLLDFAIQDETGTYFTLHTKAVDQEQRPCLAIVGDVTRYTSGGAIPFNRFQLDLRPEYVSILPNDVQQPLKITSMLLDDIVRKPKLSVRKIEPVEVEKLRRWAWEMSTMYRDMRQQHGGPWRAQNVILRPYDAQKHK